MDFPNQGPVHIFVELVTCGLSHTQKTYLNVKQKVKQSVFRNYFNEKQTFYFIFNHLLYCCLNIVVSGKRGKMMVGKIYILKEGDREFSCRPWKFFILSCGIGYYN